jgi:DNA mismatch repair protein MutS
VLRAEIRELLTPVYDFERLTSKLSLGSANGRDMIALKQSLSMLPLIERVIGTATGDLFLTMTQLFDGLEDIHHAIDEAILEEPPTTIKEGSLIKDSYHQEEKLPGLKTLK